MTVEELTALKTELKELIISTLNIKNVRADEVQDTVPLFSPENILDLDSIDAIELVMAIQEKYQVRIADQNVARNVLESINSIADFIIREPTTIRAGAVKGCRVKPLARTIPSPTVWTSG